MCAGTQAGQGYKRLLSLPQFAGSHAGSTGAMWPFAGSHRPGLPDASSTAGPEAETASDLAALLLIRPPSSLAASSELARPASALGQREQQAARGTTPDQQNGPPLMWTVQVKAAQDVAAGCNLAGLLTATSLSAGTDATGQWVQQLPAIDESDRWGPAAVSAVHAHAWLQHETLPTPCCMLVPCFSACRPHHIHPRCV